MIQRKITYYFNSKEKRTLDKQLIRELKKLSSKHSLQYALLWYTYLTKGASFRELYKVYRHLSGKLIRENTVRKQLAMLERKGLIKKVGDSYIALVDPREVTDLFDVERSKAGKVGATIKHLRLQSKSMKVSPGLVYYTKQVIETTKELVKKGKRATALDLIAHTLLPLRENETLWLWHQNIFVYYSPKTKQFRAVKSEEVSKLLRKLGFTEGVMILHTLGHRDSSRIIYRLFNRGSYSWPWARSVSYGLKELGLLQEVNELYKIQLKKLGNTVELILWNLYNKQLLCEYKLKWNYEVPEPLKNKQFITATVLGRQHVKKEIEIDDYFSKWRR